MELDEAQKILGVSTDADEATRHGAFVSQRKKLEDKLAKAPTPGLAQKYRDSIPRMEQAIEVIELAVDGEDLPALRPDYDAPEEHGFQQTATSHAPVTT